MSHDKKFGHPWVYPKRDTRTLSLLPSPLWISDAYLPKHIPVFLLLSKSRNGRRVFLPNNRQTYRRAAGSLHRSLLFSSSHTHVDTHAAGSQIKRHLTHSLSLSASTEVLSLRRSASPCETSYDVPRPPARLHTHLHLTHINKSEWE